MVSYITALPAVVPINFKSARLLTARLSWFVCSTILSFGRGARY
jgi:hypothetical protein